MKKYSAAIIGTGRIGFSLGFDKKREQPASHSFALAKNKRIKIVAACDTELDRLNAWQTYFPRATTFSSVDEMLAFGESNNNGEKSSNFDIIVVAVNEDSHLECALKAISAKPRLIILEKPVALNMEQAEKIRLASEENFVPILVNHERRFADDYKIARSWMDKIGTLQTVNARLFSGLRVYRKQDETTGEYSLLHDGTHLVDVVLYLLERNVGFAENGSQMQEGSALSNAKLVSVFCDFK
mgnify:CR=1 FL=1